MQLTHPACIFYCVTSVLSPWEGTVESRTKMKAQAVGLSVVAGIVLCAAVGSAAGWFFAVLMIAAASWLLGYMDFVGTPKQFFRHLWSRRKDARAMLRGASPASDTPPAAMGLSAMVSALMGASASAAAPATVEAPTVSQPPVPPPPAPVGLTLDRVWAVAQQNRLAEVAGAERKPVRTAPPSERGRHRYHAEKPSSSGSTAMSSVRTKASSVLIAAKDSLLFTKRTDQP